MIIHTLHFQNIHSLEGEHTIDFDSESLSSAGLFAITGPTGAGKSTILDAICLALYNQVPRLGKVSRDSLKDSGGILTRGKLEARASVEYSCAKGRFRSSWTIRINRNGNLDDYHMEIADLSTDSIIDVRRSDVPETNAGLIGLDYEQFLRSVILAQGDFARFLKAGEKERNELLEKITGGEIFRHLGAKCHEIHRSKKDLVSRLKEQLGLIQVWTPEQESEKLELKSELSNKLEAAQRSYELARQQVNFWDRYSQINERLSRLAKQQHELSLKQKEIESLKFKLKQHRRAQHLLVFREQLTIAKQQVAQNQEEAHLLKKESESIEQQSAVWKKELQELCNLSPNPTDKEWRESVEKLILQWEDLAQAIAGKQTQTESLNVFIEELIKRFPGAKQNIMRQNFCQNTDGLSELQTAIEGMNERIQLSPYFGRTTDETVTLRAELSGIYKAALDKEQQLKLQIELQQKIALKQENHVAIREKLDALLAIDKSVNQELAKLSEEIVTLQKAEQIEARAHWLNELKHGLQPGCPCPVCGAEEHPAATNAPVNGEAAMALSTALDKQKELQKSAQKQSAEIASLRARQELLEQELQQLLNQLQELNTALEALQTIPIASELHAQQEELERFIRNQEYRENLLALSHKLHELQQLKQTLQTLKQEQRGLIAGENAYSRLRKASEEGNSLSARTQIIQERIARLNLLETRANQALEAAISAAETAALQNGFSGTAEAWAAMLSAENETGFTASIQAWEKSWQESQALRSELEEEQVALKPALQGEGLEEWQSAEISGKQNLAAFNEQLGVLNQQFAQNKELQDRRASLVMQLETAEDDFNRWDKLQSLIGSSDGSKFSRMVQKVQLQILLALANVRLSSLTPRYRFHHLLGERRDSDPILSPAGKKESIYMIDLYYGNQLRAVQTLSGGETFLASLALALGLSDLASGQMEIGCLFIDEGFGSLDEETLDLALDTLERLQAESNKRIGIISHVPLLKQRIHTQIKVLPQPGGYSKVILP